MIEVPIKYYDKFTPDERVKLTLVAIARGDEEEVGRLKRTCPKKHYLQTDIAYSDKMENLEKICLLFVEISQHLYIQIIVCDFYWLNCYANLISKEDGFKLAVGDNYKQNAKWHVIQKIKEDSKKALDAIEDASNGRKAELKAVYMALQQLCTLNNLDFTQVLLWSGLHKLCPEAECYYKYKGEFNQLMYDMVLNKFLSVWNI